MTATPRSNRQTVHYEGKDLSGESIWAVRQTGKRGTPMRRFYGEGAREAARQQAREHNEAMARWERSWYIGQAYARSSVRRFVG